MVSASVGVQAVAVDSLAAPRIPLNLR